MDDERVSIGQNGLPYDLQLKLADFCEFLDEKYETKNGITALYWILSYQIANELMKGRP